MCGITGFLAPGLSREEGLQTLAAMTRTLVHRGPDSEGLWLDEGVGIGLGNRRLAILDLSPTGNQPMISATGRYVITFNGEIYNFQALRASLTGRSFAGSADTEVLLAAFEAWGFEETLERVHGMFALALWDRETRTLTLARDRLGEKPLYFGQDRGAILFGSELKAILAFPGLRPDIDRESLLLYLRYGYVPTPRSIYRGFGKLPPGHLIRWRATDVASGRLPEPRRYWDPEETARSGSTQPATGGPQELADRLEALLRTVIRRQMVTDVPLGAFLSGGVDSSTIVALMQSESRRPIETFTIGFSEGPFDEAYHAQRVAEHLGTRHRNLVLTPREAMAVIPDLPRTYDEPFGDHSQIPQVLLSRFARRHVTVALAGDGADELFGGYTRHLVVRHLWKVGRLLPNWPKARLAEALRRTARGSWEEHLSRWVRFLPQSFRQRYAGLKLQRLAGILETETLDQWYSGLVSIWPNPEELVPNAIEPLSLPLAPHHRPDLGEFTGEMLFLDQQTYLPDDILAKVDRAAMSASLETRLPFLDPDVVRFSWSLPHEMKIREGVGKWLLRQVLHRSVPRGLVERPKTGLTIPLRDWLSGPLRDWAETLLGESRLRGEGFFDPGPIRRKWAEHLAGKADWNYQLWGVLMFQAWLEHGKRTGVTAVPSTS